MEMGAALTVLVFSQYSLPVSTSMCITGATVGVGLCNGTLKAVNFHRVGLLGLGEFWSFLDRFSSFFVLDAKTRSLDYDYPDCRYASGRAHGSLPQCAPFLIENDREIDRIGHFNDMNDVLLQSATLGLDAFTYVPGSGSGSCLSSLLHILSLLLDLEDGKQQAEVRQCGTAAE
jgi:hypothetical protein